MSGSVETCPKCGALVTAQTVRCRQCGKFLQGSPLEGAILSHLLPERLAPYPATALLGFMCLVVFILMAVLAGPQSLMGFTPYSLYQLGASSSTALQDHQFWRIVTSMFGHANLLHLGFNLYALVQIGPVVESIYDRKQAVIFFVLTGVFSMTVGYYWRIEINDEIYSLSIGASGAVSGFIGIGFAALRKGNQNARHFAEILKRWIFLMLVWGFLPGIDGAAHAGGLVLGLLIGTIVPWGQTHSKPIRHLLSVLATLSLLLVAFSEGMMLKEFKGYPGHLRDDVSPVDFFGITLKAGASYDTSDQNHLVQTCRKAAAKNSFGDDMLQSCEHAIRADPIQPCGHIGLAWQLEHRGKLERALRQRRIASGLKDKFFVKKISDEVLELYCRERP